ncbi:DNA replication protein Cdc24 [Schizosaccharomyces cryophilus OY26]|uniref:DNA replication protein Cdc24 n=1 Tax=Schizosaccharomyces cryophilus (strain OY26 / ATCC MYA-4695 / CBS 11777 / NBRC 106824 / NRRL Y48691) TaxID=653667 RepID=S9VZZ2_SCHCR|nr:DNA replication protein Cdc24 [Schizosaccharomyces cryophilus OY26]EPY53263.1 DNA replication protein Cdc24 [Schizosaccharomyces cryophilus OY26]
MDFENLTKEIKQKLENCLIKSGNDACIQENWIISNVIKLFEEYPSGITWAILLNELELAYTERFYHEDRFSTLESVKDSESDVQFENSFELECVDYDYHPLPTLHLKDRRQNTCDLMLHSSYFLLFHSPFDILKNSSVRFSKTNLYPKWFLKKKLQFLPTTHFLPTLGDDKFFSFMEKVLETKEHEVFWIVSKSPVERVPQNGEETSSVLVRPVDKVLDQNEELVYDSSSLLTFQFTGSFADYPDMLDCGQYLILPYWNTFWEKELQWQEGMIGIMSSIEKPEQGGYNEQVWATGRVRSVLPTYVSLDCPNGLKEIILSPDKSNLARKTIPGEQIVVTSLKQDSDCREQYLVSSDTDLISISQLNCPLNSNFLRNDLISFKNLRAHTQGHIKVLPLQLYVFLNHSSSMESESNVCSLSFRIIVMDQFHDKISASLHPRGTEHQQVEIPDALTLNEQNNDRHFQTINLTDMYPDYIWCDIYMNHENVISIQKLSSV